MDPAASASGSRPRRPGPIYYEEILFSLRFIVGQFFSAFGEATWNQVKGAGLVLTTDYSGIGCAEVACSLFMEALHSCGRLSSEEVQGFVVCWRAAELSKPCRGVLKDHPPEQRPQHIMGDIRERLSPDTIRSVEALLKKHTTAWSNEMKGLSAKPRAKAKASTATRGETQVAKKITKSKAKASTATRGKTQVAKKITRSKDQARGNSVMKKPSCSLRRERGASHDDHPSTRAALVQKHGRLFLQDAWAEVQKFPPQRSAYCFACQAKCDVHPPPAIRGQRRYINASGNTCTPWSNLGKQMCWLDSSTIVMLAWLWSTVEALPEVVVDECVARFDWQEFGNLLSQWYVVQSCVYSPMDLGIPVRRNRRYTICVRKDMMVFAVEWSLPTLEEHFWRTLVLTGRIFFRAPQSYLNMVFAKMADARSLPRGVHPSILLAPGAQRRKEGFVQLAIQKGLSFACINVSQNSTHYKQVGPEIPTLTTSSAQLWGVDFSRSAGGSAPVDRLLVSYEKLSVHGWPVFLAPAHPLTRTLPACFMFRNMYTDTCRFSETELSAFAGNGMHLAQVGLALAFGVLGVRASAPA